MNSLCIILARGGSKGIKNKNLINFCGKPLLEWTINHCRNCKYIEETFDVVLIDLHCVNIESYNCELNVDLDFFINKLQSERSFNREIKSEYLIKVDQDEYCSESFTNIYDLYKYKKELMSEGIITPIANNKDTQKTIINFTALKSFDFSDSIIFPYKSTWITPRFDS